MMKVLLVSAAVVCSQFSAKSIIPPSATTNDVRMAGGFSPACRGATTLSSMLHKSNVVVEAGVVGVSPARNNIYAVTLRVQRILKDSSQSKYRVSKTGQKLQLLFIKPKRRSNRAQLRSLGSAKSYLSACIYEMDLKVRKLEKLQF